MAWVTAAVAVGSAAMSLAGASANKKAAGKAMRAQATADTAGRRATASGMIASVSSQNAKVERLTRSGELMEMQGKADGVIRRENYNEVQAMALVMGAASGRVTSHGSLESIRSKSESDFMWDEMWATNATKISKAAIEADKYNIYNAGSTSLMLGKEQLEVARLGSMAGQENTSAAAQQAFNNTLVSAGQSVVSSYGSSLFSKGA